MIRRERYIENVKDFKICVCGTVGAGKSTAVENLGNYYENSLVFKEMIDRELLELFYIAVKNGEKGKIEMLNQFNFLCETIKRDIKGYFYENPVKIYDRSIAEHIHVFAKMNLTYEQFFEYDFFQERFLSMLGHEGYDLGIMLVVDEEENINRIKTRGRDSEQITEDTYFRELNKMYTSEGFLKEFESYNKKTVFINTTNFTAEETLAAITKVVDAEMAERGL